MRNEKFVKLGGLLIEQLKVKAIRDVLSMGGDGLRDFPVPSFPNNLEAEPPIKEN